MTEVSAIRNRDGDLTIIYMRTSCSSGWYALTSYLNAETLLN